MSISPIRPELQPESDPVLDALNSDLVSKIRRSDAAQVQAIEKRVKSLELRRQGLSLWQLVVVAAVALVAAYVGHLL